MDRNRGVLPLAFTVIESECADSWKFFLENLYSYIGRGTGDKP